MYGKRALTKFPLIAAGALAIGIVSVAMAPAVVASASPKTGTVITTAEGAFGQMLVVGSGKYSGYMLYFITGDQPDKYSCTATIIKTLPGGPGSCTGPSNDQKAEWPAITTTGSPVAGPGVSQKLLGTVTRSGIGTQITYAGHPLYLFDQAPGQLTGEGWDEPSLPPWHGLWWLVAPSGTALPWPETLTTTTIDNKTVLAALMLTGIGWEPFPVYSYSADTPTKSACTGACAVAWPPLLVQGTPSLVGSVSASNLSTIMLADGTHQLLYKNRPLYLYSLEGIAPKGAEYVTTGSGSGLKVGGGTFNLIAP